MQEENDYKEIKYWVALNSHPKIGSRTILKLFKIFKKLSLVWKVNLSKLQNLGFDAKKIIFITEVVKKIDPDKEIEKVIKNKINLLIFPDKNYPNLLKEISDPPALLYYKGTLLKEDELSIAVVGSRKYSNYGLRACQDITYKLANSGLTIVSGLALGIDGLAHCATLEAKGRTIGVLACGLDQIYPISNTRLADKILQANGAIISEFPIGEPAQKFNFPIRNRIIAGMTLGTLVIEGAISSGSLITAQAAITYDREVFAVPGEIYSETSAGPNRLIQMGAKMVTASEDILNELSIENKTNNILAQQIIPDTKEEEIILKQIIKPKSIDEIVKESKLTLPLVNSTLIMLEMKGMVTNLGATRYVIKGKLKENSKS